MGAFDVRTLARFPWRRTAHLHAIRVNPLVQHLAAAVRAVAEHHFLGPPTSDGCVCARRHRR
jgi:hypothetical protein